MKNKTLFFALVFLLLSNTKIFAENFTFEAVEIQISGDGNIIKAADGTAFSKVDDIEIKAEKFEYNKKNLTLGATNGLAKISNKNIQIKANKFLYDENLSELTAIGNVELRDIVNKLLIKSEKIFFNSKVGIVKFDNAELTDVEKISPQ